MKIHFKAIFKIENPGNQRLCPFLGFWHFSHRLSNGNITSNSSKEMPLNFYRPIIYCFNHKKSNSTFPNLITREAYVNGTRCALNILFVKSHMRKYLFNPLVLISILYLIVSMLLFAENHVKIVNDSYRYLEYANNLKTGFYFDNHNFWYFGYAVFIFAVKQIHNSELAIVIAQKILSWIAVISIYKTSKLIFNNPKGAMITSLLSILFIEILAWNSYILCESVYCSFTCISFFVLAKIHRGSTNIGTLTLAVLVISLAVLAKPTGIALLGAISLIAFIKLKVFITNRTLRYSLIFLSCLVLILLINKMLTTYLVMENYQLGEIVYAITTITHKPEYDLLVVSVPNNLFIPSQESFPLIKILSFIIHNPIYWTKLFIGKIFYFLLHIRPYWSIQHNVFSLVVLLPLYFYAIQAVIKKRLKKDLLIFFMAYMFIHILSIGITSVDWDGRFLMPLLPAIFIVASSEIARDFERFISPILKKHKSKLHSEFITDSKESIKYK